MSERDLARSKQRILLWWLPIGAIIGMEILIMLEILPGSRWLFNGVWFLALLVMGAACLLNALRCRRVHCWFTGPWMLLMSLAMLLSMFHLLPGDPNPGLLANVAALGALLLWLLPELVFGRYFGERVD